MKTLHIKLTLNYDDTQSTDDAICQSVQNILQAHEHTVLQCEVVEHCPKCDSDQVEILHRHGTFGLPECSYRECDCCGHQWGQT
jgi:DNA-directed RNA polymerase subunit M/transcription elongation factor TFIIS